METTIKPGDLVYFETGDGEIRCLKVEEVVQRESYCVLYNHTNSEAIYSSEILPPSDPRVQEYIRLTTPPEPIKLVPLPIALDILEKAYTSTKEETIQNFTDLIEERYGLALC